MSSGRGGSSREPSAGRHSHTSASYDSDKFTNTTQHSSRLGKEVIVIAHVAGFKCFNVCTRMMQ